MSTAFNHTLSKGQLLKQGLDWTRLGLDWSWTGQKNYFLLYNHAFADLSTHNIWYCDTIFWPFSQYHNTTCLFHNKLTKT